MLDLALVGFIGLFLALGLKRPFLWVLAYIYIDIVAPQKIGWCFIQSLPISLIVFAAAFGGWLFARRQARHALHLAPGADRWCCSPIAGSPRSAPTSRSRPLDQMGLGVEGAGLRDLPAADAAHPAADRGGGAVHGAVVGTIIIIGGIKTALAAAATACSTCWSTTTPGSTKARSSRPWRSRSIPLILWLARHGTIFPPDWRVQAVRRRADLRLPADPGRHRGAHRPGLHRRARRADAALGAAQFLYAALGALALVARCRSCRRASPSGWARSELPGRRIRLDPRRGVGVDLDYVDGTSVRRRLRRLSRQQLHLRDAQGRPATATTARSSTTRSTDKARAYHSAYFEMLGEQGWPGCPVAVAPGARLWQMERIRRRYRKRDGGRDEPGSRRSPPRCSRRSSSIWSARCSSASPTSRSSSC